MMITWSKWKSLGSSFTRDAKAEKGKCKKLYEGLNAVGVLIPTLIFRLMHGSIRENKRVNFNGLEIRRMRRTCGKTF